MLSTITRSSLRSTRRAAPLVRSHFFILLQSDTSQIPFSPPTNISLSHTHKQVQRSLATATHPPTQEPTDIQRGNSKTPYYLVGAGLVLGTVFMMTGGIVGGVKEPSIPKTGAVKAIEDRLTPAGDAVKNPELSGPSDGTVKVDGVNPSVQNIHSK